MSLNERVHEQPKPGTTAHLQRLANLHKTHSGHGGEILKKVEGEIEKHHGPQALQHVRDASAADAQSFKSHVNKAEAASSAYHNHGSVKMEKTEIVRAILSKDETKLAEAKAAIKELLSARATQFRADSSKFVAKSLFEGTEQVDEAGDDIHKIAMKHAEHTMFGREKQAKKLEDKIKNDHGEEALKHIKAHTELLGSDTDTQTEMGRQSQLHIARAKDASDKFRTKH